MRTKQRYKRTKKGEDDAQNEGRNTVEGKRNKTVMKMGSIRRVKKREKKTMGRKTDSGGEEEGQERKTRA